MKKRIAGAALLFLMCIMLTGCACIDQLLTDLRRLAPETTQGGPDMSMADWLWAIAAKAGILPAGPADDSGEEASETSGAAGAAADAGTDADSGAGTGTSGSAGTIAGKAAGTGTGKTAESGAGESTEGSGKKTVKKRIRSRRKGSSQTKKVTQDSSAEFSDEAAVIPGASQPQGTMDTKTEPQQTSENPVGGEKPEEILPGEESPAPVSPQEVTAPQEITFPDAP